MHESGRTLFPGTGWADQVGSGDALGTNVNVALPMGTGDAGWLRAFDAVVPQVLRAFAPQVMLTQHGCDTHALDPLAHLMMSVDGQRVAYRRLHELAHELCGGRWIAVGGGGYEPVQVVPRAWTHLLAEVTGAPVDGATPGDWRDLAQRHGGELAPTSLTDGAVPDFVPWEGGPGGEDDPVDRAVRETREHAFPHLGLDPMRMDG
jgi:acetoin utilization protein AcuC